MEKLAGTDQVKDCGSPGQWVNQHELSCRGTSQHTTQGHGVSQHGATGKRTNEVIPSGVVGRQPRQTISSLPLGSAEFDSR